MNAMFPDNIFVTSCLGFVAYTYVGYPLLMLVLSLVIRRKVKPDENCERPSVTFIIPARNSEHFIREKIVNTLAINQQDARSVEIVIVSDESTDGTDDIVREYQNMDVRLIRLEDRAGKESGQQVAIENTDGEIIVFTDVRAQLEPESLSNFLAYFKDPKIGAVSSIDAIPEGLSGEALYVRYEMWLRALESRVCSLVGLSGSCFAARRSVCDNWHEDIPSDFFTALNTVRAGYRSVLARDIPCTYGVQKDTSKEYSRKVRTVLRGLTCFFSYWTLLVPLKYGFFSFQFFSHKLCRWLIPFFLIAGVAVLLVSTESVMTFSLGLVGVYLFLLAAGFAWYLPAAHENILCRVALFFALSNVAIVHAWIDLVRGKRMVTWEPTKA
ncbi:MAG: glycosyltransferase [Bdellovibrionales bacterium]|nr:glycosyltransferase [Bdellovibrionales bacterium]